MAEKSGLFNAVGGEPAYTDVDMARMFSLLTGGQGYLVGKESELEVTAGTGLQVLVGTGAAWIGEPAGWWYQNDAQISLSIDSEVADYDRIDRVVLRMDRGATALSVIVAVLKGNPAASNPVAPVLTQNETIYELSIAQVYVTGGDSSSVAVTDERNDTSVCGRVYTGQPDNYNHIVTATNGNTYEAYPAGISHSKIDTSNRTQSDQDDTAQFPVGNGTLVTFNNAPN